VQCNEANYADYAKLLKNCFPGSDKFSRDYIYWLYKCNPDGEVVGFDARDGERLVAHYSCIPVRAQVGGKDVRVLLSLNTATHPKYRGQGLFTKLAKLTYQEGIEQGFDCVYGVANANSTPGFSRKLGFQVVGSLSARIGFGPLRIDFSPKVELHFCRSWNEAALSWRCKNPANKVFVKKQQNFTTLAANAFMRGLVTAVTSMKSTLVSGDNTMTRYTPIRLFIGIVPPSWQRFSFYIKIPVFLRPSPLNLIYRSLSGRVEKLDSSMVFLSFVDFDAY